MQLSSISRALLGLALAALAPAALRAQTQPPARDTAAARPPAPVPAAPVAADTSRAAAAARITPKGAFLRSLVLPGWGQSAIGSPGRGSVYFAMEATSLWMVYKSRRKLGAAREQEEWLHETGQLEEERHTGLVNSREQQVEDWITLAGFVLLFNAADAFVAAHLGDFDARIGTLPTPRGLEVRATLPVGGRP